MTVKADERRWIFLFGGVVMLITTLPYLLGYARQGSDFRFSGALLGIEDINSYLANIVSGSAGMWLFETPYTAYPQQGTLVFLPYLLLGKLAAAPGLHDQVVALFHLFRILAGMLSVWATYDFIALFIHQVRWRRFGTLLAVVGGGCGYLILLSGRSQLLGSLPIELYSPEAFGFLMIYSIPHLALARALLLWSLRAFLMAGQQKKKALVFAGLKTGILCLLTALAQPLTGMIAGAVIAVYLAVTGLTLLIQWAKKIPANWQAWRPYFTAGVLAGIVAGPFAAYNVLSVQINPLLKAWSGQSAIPSAHPLLYILAYGLLVPFSAVGAWNLFQKNRLTGAFLVIWAVVFTAAIYIPFSWQRRLIDGVWVVLVCLACASFEVLESTGRWQQSVRKVSLGLLLLSLPATLLIFAGGILTANYPAPPAFIPADEARAFDALASLGRPGEVVLAASASASPLPAWAPMRVVAGNSTLSINYDSLVPQITRFYQQEMTDTERRSFLDHLGVRYVFWGTNERSLGNWDPHQTGYLKQVYSDRGYVIFDYIDH